jgi:hypothetical protein
MVQESNAFDKWLARAVNWKEAIGWLVAGSAAMSGVASQIAALAQYGWAAVVLVGIVLACICFPLVVGGMVIWRAYKSKRREAALPEPLTEHGVPVAVGRFLADATDRIRKLEAAARRLEQTPALDEAAFKKEILLKASEHVNHLFELQAKIDSAQGDRMKAIEGDLETDRAEVKKVLNQFSVVFIAFQALLARERLNETSERLIKEGRVLFTAPDKGAVLHGKDWQSWTHKLRNWEGALDYWCKIAGSYFPDTKGFITNVPRTAYTDGDWHIEDSQFPDANAVFIYKTFANHFENWAKIKDEVMTRVHISAFGGPGALDALANMRVTVPTLKSPEEIK